MIPLKKLVITHLFLNLYLLVLVQPALPVLEYLLNYDYIVQELCENRDKPILSCNGKCYLENQLEKQQDHHDHENRPLPPTIEFEKFISLTAVLIPDLPIEDPKPLNSPWVVNRLKDSLFATCLLRPPIV